MMHQKEEIEQVKLAVFITVSLFHVSLSLDVDKNADPV